MSNVTVLVISSATILAMAGAFFGVSMARFLWADDLKHTQEMRVIWNKTEKSMKSIIKSQEEIIDSQNRTLDIYRKNP